MFCRTRWALINSSTADWTRAGGCIRASLGSVFQRMCFCLSAVWVCCCCRCMHRLHAYVVCELKGKTERQLGSGPFLLYNCLEGFLCSLQKPFPLFSDGWMFPGTRGTVLCMFTLLLTGVSCFTVCAHPYFVRSDMPVHVQICVCALLLHLLFYTSSGQIVFHHRANLVRPW